MIHAAERALEDSRDSSRLSKASHAGRCTWVPAIPAAQAALLTVLVHTQGVAAAGQAMIAAHEQLQAQAASAAAGGASDSRKTKGQKRITGGSAAAAVAKAVDALQPLLPPSAINGFLAAAVGVVKSAQEACDEGLTRSTAFTAINAVQAVRQAELSRITAAAEAALAAGGQAASPALVAHGTQATVVDATSLLLLSELHLAAGSTQRGKTLLVAALMQPDVKAAARADVAKAHHQQLAQPQRLWRDSLQSVLATLAATCIAADNRRAVVQLLGGLAAGGVRGVSLPALAQQLEQVAEGKVAQVRPLHMSAERAQHVTARGLRWDSLWLTHTGRACMQHAQRV